MVKALVLSLGTGRGVESGITQSIKSNNPDYIVFLATVKSKDTLERVPLKNELSKRKYSVEELVDENDAERCYITSKKVIKELRANGYDEIWVDFTSGTKAMTGGLILAAVIEDVAQLVYVSGERSEDGRVISTTERIHTIPSPADILIDLKKKTLTAMFNNYQFYDCLNLIKDLEKYPQSKLESHNIAAVKKIAEIYYDWDLFRHKEADEKMKESGKLIEKVVSDVDQLNSNKEFLGRLANNGEQTLYLADIIANAERRIKEGRYDDAVGRLYRSIELIAEIAASSKLGFNIKDLKLSNLRPDLQEKYKRDAEGEKLELGLKNLYELLYDYSNEIGERYKQDKELQNYLSKRNQSILAHGLSTVEEDVAKNLHMKVLE
ncbi:MAG: TIGR02710 family CRISPR-associated CARF protein, partial [Nitrososphaerales archaeon]